jgi:hypothetical protein
MVLEEALERLFFFDGHLLCWLFVLAQEFGSGFCLLCFGFLS